MLGLGFKLLAAPAILILIYFGGFGWTGLNMRITLFESAMGPQIGAAIVATQYGLNPALVTMMVGIGTLLAFATVPAWWAVLGAF
jgi:predicted permease